MPIDPNHRALLRAVGKLTTQVGRIADTLAPPVDPDDDGAQTTGDDTRERIADALTTEHYRRAAEGIVASPEEHCAAFADVVMTTLQSDGDIRPLILRTISRWEPVHDTPAEPPAWALCSCGDKPVTAQHPEPCPLSQEPHASRLAEMYGAPWPAPPYKLCSASTHGALGHAVGPCVLRYLHDGPVHVAADGATFAASGGTIAPWLPTCESGRHYQHAGETCDSVDTFTERVQDWAQRMAVPERTQTTSGAEKQRTIRRQQFRILLNQLNAGVTPLTTDQVQALTAYVADEIVECNMETQEADRLDAELDRIRRALDPDDETYIQETVDDQLAMTAKVAELEATIGRVREVQAWLARNYPGLKEPASRLFLALSPANKEG